MRHLFRPLGSISLVVAAACNSSGGTSNTDPGPKVTQAFQQADPAGDTLSFADFPVTVPALDLTLVRGEYKGDSLILTLAFGGPVQPYSAMAANSIAGWIELDSDNNPATGDDPLSDLFGGTASLGIDYTVDLTATTPTRARIYNDSTGVESSIGATFSGNTMTIRLVRDSIGNTGAFGLVALIGVEERPTDLFPNSGAIVVQGAASLLLPGAARPIPLPEALRPVWGRRPWQTRQ